ncbi:MAG TPA: hypothetical protein PK335_09875 [Draconibacterium sp.]|nr:hypothetical protein [Draconibacterium sp.]
MDELKNIAPELSKLKKEVPFSTPEGYFDDFSARLQMRIEAEKQTVAPRKTRFLQIFKPALGLAASFALIFLLVYVPLKTFMPDQENTVAVVTDSVDPNLMNVIEHLDESSFFTMLDDDNTNSEFTDDELTMYVSANFNDYEIYENLDIH